MKSIFCPVCGKPAVDRYDRRRTLMKGSRGYDDDGNYHNHDPNWSIVKLTCEEDHKWRRKKKKSCPSCDYGGEVKLEVIEGEESEE